MAFESGVVPDESRSIVIILVYKDKGKKTDCKNFRSFSLLRIVGKIYVKVVVMEIVSRLTEGLRDDEQGGFRSWRGWIDQIFTKAIR